MVSKLQDFSVNLLGKALVPVESAKDLDLTLDGNITFDEHIVKTVSSGQMREFWANNMPRGVE